MDAFKTQVKNIKSLARGCAPAKSPGYYSCTAIETGRDGNLWNTCRVYHLNNTDGYNDEIYELVWIQTPN
jgi:hypothetical protein